MVYRIDNATAVPARPAPAAVGPNPNGYFAQGNATTVPPTPGTIVDNDWANAVQEELVGVAVASGQTPSKTNNGQVAAAMVLASAPIGRATNLNAYVAAASQTVNVTADEIVVGAVLGGLSFKMGNFNQTLNLANVGANGMDTGAAPNNAYVAIYAILNPSTGAQALLAQALATNTKAATVYAGSNMPAGYVQSGLISVWPTSGSGKLIQAFQKDRRLSFGVMTILSTTAAQSSLTLVTGLAAFIPQNARTVWGSTNVQDGTSTATAALVDVAATATGIGQAYNQSQIAGGQLVQNFTLDLVTAQTIYYVCNTTPNQAGSQYSIYLTAYEI